jgi:sugar (pentulose or hexulose) kinase
MLAFVSVPLWRRSGAKVTPPLILTIDVGTSSMRADLWTRDGLSVHSAQRKYSPTYLGEGAVEQDPITWLEALVELAQEAVRFASTGAHSIDALTLTAQRSSLVPVDRSGMPIGTSIMWQDKRSQTICDRLLPFAEAIYQRCGSLPNTVFLGPKISWLRENQPETYNHAYKLVAIPDLLLHFIVGTFVTDATYASRTLLMDLVTRQWNEDLLDLFKIDPSKLSTIVEPGVIVGYSSASFQALTDMKSGTPVISAGGDQQCAAIGAGVFDANRIQVNTGTGSFVIAPSDSIKFHQGMGLTCGCSAVPGKYILEASILTTATIYEWFNREFFREESYETINREALSSPVRANGLLLIPHFEGRGSPDWNSSARGVFYNLRLGSTRGDMARAILEGIAAEIAENLEALEGMIGTGFDVVASGGLTKSPVFQQIQADMYGRTVALAPHHEASSFGAWISGLVALGLSQDHKSAMKLGTKNRNVSTSLPDRSHTAQYRELRTYAATIYKALISCG